MGRAPCKSAIVWGAVCVKTNNSVNDVKVQFHGDDPVKQR